MAQVENFEISTFGFGDRRSSSELHLHIYHLFILAIHRGYDPLLRVRQTRVLPLHQWTNIFGGEYRIRTDLYPACKAGVHPKQTHSPIMAEGKRIELLTFRLGWFSRPLVRHAPYPPNFGISLIT